MNILAWNVRGLGSASKRATIKDTITSLCPDIVILSETKSSSINNKFIKSLWSSISIAWASLDASGASGGIILLWDQLSTSAVEVICGHFSISVHFKLADNFTWWLTGVYSPVKQKKRKLFWQELFDLNGLCGPIWLLGEDFNIYRWSHETSSANPPQTGMNKFNHFIDFAGLIDPFMNNGQYTWSNLRPHIVLSRINRFLYSKGWSDKFSHHHIKRLPRACSDHYPILLEPPNQQWGHCPFRLENLWLQDKHFQQHIEAIWSSGSSDGYLGYALIKKLNTLAQDIKRLRKNFGPNIPREKAKIMEKILSIDKQEETGFIDKTDCHL
ncbi:uncharacterized protein LOC111014657 [Momordica charantia]|uniref:Uncharacterized protein LOC111014657 n=1 Tax=Momordica charantia TaxID=3673 RepID=A0A6J1CVN2_MOMCH|nr:uncharacterized protein LOC111014657 [Momordica charantia]